MLNEDSIQRVNHFLEKLKDRLKTIGMKALWGAPFELSPAPRSDYDRAPVNDVEGQPIRKNWLQINNNTYFHPSYTSPKPWACQARFFSTPGGPLWEKKEPYVYDRQPREFSLGGLDVYAISYDKLDEALANRSEDDIMEEVLADLRISWAYSNGQQLPQDSADSMQSAGRVDITLSISASVWSEFQKVYAQRYRSRRKHTKRPSYAELRDDAVNAAFRDYIDKCKKESQDEDK